jgi:hypothetical protein
VVPGRICNFENLCYHVFQKDTNSKAVKGQAQRGNKKAQGVKGTEAAPGDFLMFNFEFLIDGNYLH